MGRNNRRDSDGNRRSATWLFLDCDTVYGGADHYWHSVCRCAWVLSSPISFETYFKRPPRYRCRPNRQRRPWLERIARNDSGRLAADDLLGDPDLLRRDGAGYVPGDISRGVAKKAVMMTMRVSQSCIMQYTARPYVDL